MIVRRLLLVLLLGGLGIQSAWADPMDRWERRQEKRERREEHLTNGLVPGNSQTGRSIGPGEAARLAQARNGGGRVLDVVSTPDGWRVKLVKAGEVRTVMISADSP